MDFNFEEDLQINKFSLDDEWTKQPNLFHKWSTELSQIEMERDRAKEKIELVRAELDLKIRSDPDSFNLSKVTEASVQSAIVTSEGYQKAVDEYLKLKYNHKVIQSAIESLNHKKYALDNLVRLYLSEYYLKESPPKDRNAMLDDLNKDIKLKKRLKRE